MEKHFKTKKEEKNQSRTENVKYRKKREKQHFEKNKSTEHTKKSKLIIQKLRKIKGQNLQTY